MSEHTQVKGISIIIEGKLFEFGPGVITRLDITGNLPYFGPTEQIDGSPVHYAGPAYYEIDLSLRIPADVLINKTLPEPEPLTIEHLPIRGYLGE